MKHRQCCCSTPLLTPRCGALAAAWPAAAGMPGTKQCGVCLMALQTTLLVLGVCLTSTWIPLGECYLGLMMSWPVNEHTQMQSSVGSLAGTIIIYHPTGMLMHLHLFGSTLLTLEHASCKVSCASVLTAVCFPDFFAGRATACFSRWDLLVPAFTFKQHQPMHAIMVPTVDTCRWERHCGLLPGCSLLCAPCGMIASRLRCACHRGLPQHDPA